MSVNRDDGVGDSLLEKQHSLPSAESRFPYVAHEARLMPPAVAIDCLHGSRRSIGVLMSTFSFVAAAALTLIILSFRTLPPESTTLTMVVSPPSSGVFGVALQPFAARLTNGQTPIVGVPVAAKLRLTQPFPVLALLNSSDDQQLIRTVNCLDDLYGLDPLYASQNSGICGEQNLYNNVVVTDSDGFATFSNLYVTNGVPQEYALSISVAEPYNIDLQSVISFAGPLPKLEITSAAAFAQNPNGPGTLITATVYVKWLTSASIVNSDGSAASLGSSEGSSASEGGSGGGGLSTDGSAPPAPPESSGSAVSSSGAPSQKDRRFDELGSSASLGWSSFFGVSSSGSSGAPSTFAELFGAGFRGFETTVIPLDLSRQPVFLGDFDVLPFPALHGLANMTSPLQLLNITKQYVTAVANVSVVVLSSSVKSAALGLFFLGEVMPLTFLVANGSDPQFAMMTIPIYQDIVSVKLSSSAATISESSALLVSVSVATVGIVRSQGIYFFASPVVATYAAPSSTPNVTLPRQEAFGSLRRSTAVFPKILLTQFLQTDPTGNLANAALLFSLDGGVGMYNIFAVCAGVSSTPLQINVTSSVVAKRSKVFATYAPWSSSLTRNSNNTLIEQVGAPFATVPQLFLRNVTGGAVSHKYVVVSSPTIGLLVPDTFSNADGVATVTGIIVPSMSRDGMPSIREHNISFVVDDILVGILTVLLDSSYNAFTSKTSCVVRTVPTNTSTASASLAVANKALDLQFLVVDEQNVPLPNQQVTFTTMYPTTFSRLHPNMAQSQLYSLDVPNAEPSSAISLVSDANGFINFASQGQQIAATPDLVLSSTDKTSTFLSISSTCSQSMFTDNTPTFFVALPLYNPIRSITVVGSTYGALNASADIDWGLQGSSAPLTITWGLVMQDVRLAIFSEFYGFAVATFPPLCDASYIAQITLECPSYVEGDVLMAAGVYRTVQSVLSFTIPRTVGSVEIVQDIVVRGLGAPAVLPKIGVRGVAGDLLQNAVVAVQMILPGQGNRSLAFTGKDMQIGLVYPYFAVTGSDGYATFTEEDLSVLGYPNNEAFSFQFVSGLTADRSRNQFVLPDTMAVQSCDVSALASAAFVPGQALPPICVTLQGLPNGTTVVPVSVLMTSHTFGPATLSPSYLTCTVTTPTAPATCNGTFTLDRNTPPDTFSLRIAVPGAVSDPIPVTVSWTPTSVVVLQQPPQNTLIGSVIEVSTRAVSGSNVPVPSVVIGVTLVSSAGKCNKNFPFSCGSISGSTYAVTDSRGFANFSFSIPMGAEGLYTLNFQVAGKGNAALQGSVASVESVAQTFLGPFFGQLTEGTVPRWLKELSKVTNSLPSALSQKLQSLLSGISAQSMPFKLWNPVARITIPVQPQFTATVKDLPSNLRVAPVLRLLDRNGSFVPNVPVSVMLSSPSCSFTRESVTTVFSDAAGYVYFQNLAVDSSSNPGKYYLAFVAYGVTNFSRAGSIVVNSVPPPSMSEEMRILCLVLVVLLMPLLIANLPFSSIFWLPFSVLILIGLALAIAIEARPLLEQDPSVYEVTYAGFVTALWILMLGSVVFLGVLRLLKRIGKGQGINKDSKLPAGSVIALHEDEFRVAHGFAYTKWLATARRGPSDTMTAYKKELNTAIDKSLIGRIKNHANPWVRKIPLTVNYYNANTVVPMRPMEPPQDIIPVFLPVRYWIALAILFVIYFVAVLFSVYVEQSLHRALSIVVDNLNFEATVPMPKGLTNITGGVIEGVATAADGSHDFTEPLTEAIKFVVSVDSHVHFLSRLLPLVSPTLFHYITMMFTALVQIRNALTGAFITAHIIAACAIAVAVLLMTRSIPRHMMFIRRGYHRLHRGLSIVGGEAPLASKFSITLADDYIGLQVIVYIVQHQLAFWVTVLVYLVIACDFTRTFIISKLLAIVTVSLAVSILRTIVVKTLVKKFAASGITVVNNLVYGFWSVFSSVLGTIDAAIATVTRLGKGIGLVVFLFPRIDHGLLPEDFSLLDKGYLIFWSMLISDAAHTSPVLLSFASILIADTQLRLLNENSDGTLLLINRESFAEITRMPNLANMVRQRLTFLLRQSVLYHARVCGSSEIDNPMSTGHVLGLAQPASKLIQTQYFYTARRWWLFYVLSKNPSLRALRKHRMAQENKAIGAVAVQEEGATYAKKRRGTAISDAEMLTARGTGNDLSKQLLNKES